MTPNQRTICTRKLHRDEKDVPSRCNDVPGCVHVQRRHVVTPADVIDRAPEFGAIAGIELGDGPVAPADSHGVTTRNNVSAGI